MEPTHHLILLASTLGLLSIFAGLFSARFGTPLLLVFLAIGILFGKDGPVGLVFDNFQSAYLIGSVALAVILFEGGLKTKRSMLKIALWPAMSLASDEPGHRWSLDHRWHRRCYLCLPSPSACTVPSLDRRTPHWRHPGADRCGSSSNGPAPRPDPSSQTSDSGA
jgi:hypothetical protein